MLIRNGGESIYFFSKFCLHFAADIVLNLLNIWPRRLTSEFGVVAKKKTPKTKTRRPRTYENEDLRKRRPTKTKTYENEDLRKLRPPTKTKTPLRERRPLRKRRPQIVRQLIVRQLIGRQLIVGQGFGKQTVNCVAFSDGKSENILMFLYL